MATDQTEALNCAVCGEPIEPALSAECNWCDARFHLNQRNGLESKDCGQVWIDEQFLALQFACGNCLAAGGAPAAPPAAPEEAQRTAPDAEPRRRYRKRA